MLIVHIDSIFFLRRDKIEMILQDTLFQPRPLLEDTVQKTLADVLVIREDILTRTKSIRSEDGEVTICPEQGIKQEEKLTEIRMSGSTKPKWRAFRILNFDIRPHSQVVAISICPVDALDQGMMFPEGDKQKRQIFQKVSGGDSWKITLRILHSISRKPA